MYFVRNDGQERIKLLPVGWKVVSNTLLTHSVLFEKLYKQRQIKKHTYVLKLKQFYYQLNSW
jgi:hypothetical protein